MKKYAHLGFLFIFIALNGCTSKLKNGTYHLDYAFKGTETNVIAEEDQELRIEKDKVKLITYEKYLKPIGGYIYRNRIILDNGDTLQFIRTKEGLNTRKGENVYVWVYNNK